MNKIQTSSLVAGLLLATNLYSNENLSEITVTSGFIETTEKSATYATEIYTKEEIQNSNSKDVYDFLSSQTSINVAPSYGNTFSQKIDLRGYGIGDGYQNVVVSVNGRRLNNVDMVSQLLSAVPLDSIEKIEILKGTGSVQYGDGANAGAINIITNGKYENYIKASAGSNGTKNGTLSLGYANDKVILNGFLDYTKTNGTRVLSDGRKDKNYNRNKDFNIIYFPTDELELRAGKKYSKMNILYGGSLTKADYDQNPNKASSFTENYLQSYVTNVGTTYTFSPKYSIDANYFTEDRLSKYTYSSGYKSNTDYDTESFNTKLDIKGDRYKAVIGVDGYFSDRRQSSNTTTKDNKGVFFSTNYFVNQDVKLSFGARKEYVDYTYVPNSGTRLNKDLSLNAYDLGVNYQIDETHSVFANYNKSFQAPDIDRFFNYGGTFNGFIEPAKVQNFTVGYNNIQKSNKLKISLFRANLKNEIYYYKLGGTSRNTNIDKSHKYGVEFFDKYLINDNLFTSINYSYIIAKIDEENDGNGTYNGKDLPGVSKHNVTVNLGYTYNKYKAVASHTYRSSAYAANDFANSFSQKQEAYNSTDVSLGYNYKNIEFFAKVQNLFDESNGIWIKDDSIYPVNFERTYNFGTKIKF
ncbi:TonB-dependent receptor [Poseidonibacter lekithochrous]|uniref:TonB-dependent receptor n=1 Tax=Poseidonibacter lekithochrous TaxID=1904463 RepID=UPI000D36DCCB|nr:TonB-dependent receptor [Poseidonibacter lekithochrous]